MAKKTEHPAQSEPTPNSILEEQVQNKVLKPLLSLIPSSKIEEDALKEIFTLLEYSTQVDFSHYRQTSVLRRMSRRMAQCKQNTYLAYLQYIQKNQGEIHHLYDDLLLSFTKFFRDGHIFQALKEKVFPKLVKNRSAKTPIRIWVPGCSTGEEVYSLAISLYEFLEASPSKAPIQFFGTDLVERHINKARAGCYSVKIEQEVSKERLERFFDRTQDGYRVITHIREMCVFATQNITQDPPFPNIDLVSCRNVLIYFDATLQETVIPLFHFSLKPTGHLLLGSSETMNRFSQLFHVYDAKANLYTKRISSTKPDYRFPLAQNPQKWRARYTPLPSTVKSSTPEINQRVHDFLLKNYSPPGMLIDSSMQIQQFIGEPSAFLKPPSGEASLKLSKMVIENIRPDLYVAIEEARKTGEQIRKENLHLKRGLQIHTFDLSVTPMPSPQTNEAHFLILFEKPVQQHLTQKEQSDSDSEHSHFEKQILKQELQSAKAHLQAIIEEKDEMNQELWAANEEVLSTNEELQSVNEELEAAKEELESSNEELMTLNEQLQTKNHELIASKEFVENLVETANTIVLTLDNNAKITLFNRFAEELTGYTKDEVFGKNWFELFVPEIYRKQSQQRFSAMLSNTRESYRYEDYIITKHGEERSIEWNNSQFRDAHSGGRGILCIGTDLTQRKITELALRKSEGFLSTIYNNSDIAIYVLQVNGLHDMVYESVNTQYQKSFGIDKEEVKGKAPRDLEPYFGKEGVEYSLRMFEECATTKKANRSEYKVETSGNTPSWWLNRLTPLLDANDEVYRIIGTSVNITEHKLAELALRKSEKHLREAQSVARIGSFEALMDQEKMNWSSELYRLFGQSPLSFTPSQESFLSLIHPDDVKGYAQAVTKSYVTGNRIKQEFRARHADGEWRYFEVLGKPSKGRDGKINGTRGTLQDITESKKLEQDKKKLERQLLRSQKLETIGTLAGGIAHDFNNILMPIIGYTEMVMDSMENADPNAEDLEYVFKSALRAKDLVEQILLFGKQIEKERVPLQLDLVVKEAMILMRSSIPSSIEIVQEIDPSCNKVLADESQIHQVLINLCTNAWQTMEDTGGTLTVSVQQITIHPELAKIYPKLTDDEYVCLKVIDTGQGIESQTMEHIFEPFYTTKAVDKGTGLGLSVVHGIVQSHNGEIIVDSIPGSGTEFQVFLPIVREEQDDDSIEPVELKGGPESVLVVDDEASIAKMVSKMLRSLGYEVVSFTDSPRALQAFEDSPESFDMVISDLTMPYFSGIQLAEKLQEIRPGIPILIITGYGDSSLTDTSMAELGITQVLKKPLTRKELAIAVRFALHMKLPIFQNDGLSS